MKFGRKVLAFIMSTAMVTGMGGPVAAGVKEIPLITIQEAASNYPEGVEGFIARLYDLVMGRGYDSEGLKFWKGQLRGGSISASNLARYFFSCDEYYNLNYDLDKYISVLYRVFFDREPDQGGFDFWKNSVYSYGSTRRDVLEGFINSTEWANVCAKYMVVCGTGVSPTQETQPTAGITNFVKSLYKDVLGRDADEAGLKYWAGELSNMRTTAKNAAYGFFYSNEFKKAFKAMTPEERVTVFYKVFLGRKPDKDGLKFWAGQAKNEGSMDVLFAGFADSAEFADKCGDAGIITAFPPTEAQYAQNRVENEYYPITFADGRTEYIFGHYDKDLAWDVYLAVNAYRTQHGLSELSYSQDLQVSANLRAREIVYNVSHKRLDGSTFDTSLSSGGLRAENLITSTNGGTELFMNAWKNSGSHNANMLKSDISTMAVSIFVADGSCKYASDRNCYYYAIQHYK